MEKRWRYLLTKEHSTNCQIWRWQNNDLGMFFIKSWGQNSSNMPKSTNRSCKKIWSLLLRVLSYLLITFSSRIMIPSIQLNLWRSGCLKIMLMFCNGQFSPMIFIQFFENSKPKNNISKHQYSKNNIYQGEWHKIPINYCKKLTENYRKRLVSAEVNKEYFTKY